MLELEIRSFFILIISVDYSSSVHQNYQDFIDIFNKIESRFPGADLGSSQGWGGFLKKLENFVGVFYFFFKFCRRYWLGAKATLEKIKVPHQKMNISK